MVIDVRDALDKVLLSIGMARGLDWSDNITMRPDHGLITHDGSIG